MRLAGKVALITGAARGIGACEARLFAREGARVVVADILEGASRRVVADIGDAGGEAVFVRLDVAREDDWRRAVAETVAFFGRLDVLVNNAGIYRVTPIERLPEGEWDAVMAVNAKGTFLGTKHAIPAMRRAGGGSIVNTSSTTGLVGNPRGGAYGASKGAIRVFTKFTAVQHAADGIRANSVHPGPVETDMIADNIATPERRGAVVGRVPLGRLGTVEDVAFAALFLASDESSFMTGSELVVDGGYSAR